MTIDAIIVRAHQHNAGARKNEFQRINIRLSGSYAFDVLV